jgi:hypothetical protein
MPKLRFSRFFGKKIRITKSKKIDHSLILIFVLLNGRDGNKIFRESFINIRHIEFQIKGKALRNKLKAKSDCRADKKKVKRAWARRGRFSFFYEKTCSVFLQSLGNAQRRRFGARVFMHDRRDLLALALRTYRRARTVVIVV